MTGMDQKDSRTLKSMTLSSTRQHEEELASHLLKLLMAPKEHPMFLDKALPAPRPAVGR